MFDLVAEGLHDDISAEWPGSERVSVSLYPRLSRTETQPTNITITATQYTSISHFHECTPHARCPEHSAAAQTPKAISQPVSTTVTQPSAELFAASAGAARPGDATTL